MSQSRPDRNRRSSGRPPPAMASTRTGIQASSLASPPPARAGGRCGGVPHTRRAVAAPARPSGRASRTMMNTTNTATEANMPPTRTLAVCWKRPSAMPADHGAAIAAHAAERDRNEAVEVQHAAHCRSRPASSRPRRSPPGCRSRRPARSSPCAAAARAGRARGRHSCPRRSPGKRALPGSGDTATRGPRSSSRTPAAAARIAGRICPGRSAASAERAAAPCSTRWRSAAGSSGRRRAWTARTGADPGSSAPAAPSRSR